MDDYLVVEQGGEALRSALLELLSAPWDLRWKILERKPILLSERVARRCNQLDSLLGSVIQRAIQTGVSTAKSEFPAGQDLTRALRSDLSSVSSRSAVASTMVEACDKITHLEINWLRPHLLTLVDNMARQPMAVSDPAVASADLQSRYCLSNVDPQSALMVSSLISQSWDDVWLELSVVDPNVLTSASAAFTANAAIYDRQRYARAIELTGLVEATCKRGLTRAIAEHQQLRDAIGLLQYAEHLLDPSGELADHAVRLHELVSQHSATWLLRGATACAGAALSLLAETDSRRPLFQSNFAAMLARSIIEQSSEESFAEVVRVSRQAVIGCDASDPRRRTYLENYAKFVCEAVSRGVHPRWGYRVAVQIFERMIATRGEGETDLDLLSGYSTAVLRSHQELGLDPEQLVPVELLMQQALKDAPEIAFEDRHLLINRSVILGLLVDAGNLKPDALLEAAAGYAQALELASSVRERCEIFNNIGLITLDAIEYGVLPISEFHSALQSLEVAVSETSLEATNGINYRLGFSHAILTAVEAGVLPSTSLLRAIELVEEVLATKGQPAELAAELALRLGNLTSVAVQAAVLDERTAEEIRQYVRTVMSHAQQRGDLGGDIALAMFLRSSVQDSSPDPRPLDEAVRLLERARTSMPRSRATRLSIATNLSNTICHAVRRKILPNSRLLQAVELQAEALALASTGGLFRRRLLTNYAYACIDAVEARVLNTEILIEAQQCAAEALTLTPRHHRMRAQNIGLLAITTSLCVYYGVIDASEAADLLSGLLDDSWDVLRRIASGPAQRTRALEYLEPIVDRATEIVLAGRGPIEGIRTVEALRNHLYAGVRVPPLPVDSFLPHEVEATYRKASEQFRAVQYDFRDNLASHDDLIKARGELGLAVDEVRRYGGFEHFGQRPTVQELSAAIPQNCVAVYVVAGGVTGAALVLDPQGSVTSITLPLFTREYESELVDELKSEEPNLVEVGKRLWDVVVGPILSQWQGSNDWLLVPVGVAEQVPWQIAGSTEVGWVDDFVTLSVLPTLLLPRSEMYPEASGGRLIASGDDRDLALVRADRAVANYFCSSDISVSYTRSDTLVALAETPFALLSGHGFSQASLGGTIIFPDGLLTSDDVDGVPSRARGLAILNSCSSADVSSQFVGESIGLRGAMLSAGFDGVVAMSWPVSDAVAFVTASRIELELSKGASGRTSVRNARVWLREVTANELRQWIEHLRNVAPDLGVEGIRVLDQWLGRFSGEERPLGDPSYWAACSLYGFAQRLGI